MKRHLPLFATGGVLALLFVAAGLRYKGFFAVDVAVNLFTDNAFLGIAAVGMTLVIFSGGIDLSIGAVIGFTSIFAATMVMSHHWHPALAWTCALLIGAVLGAAMGALIHVFRLPAFLITLAGMFLARGAAYWLNTESVGITHPWYDAVANFAIECGPLRVPAPALLVLAALALGFVVAHYTRFGRTLLAIGGNESSALLMGLPVGGTKIAVYALNGVCGAAAGIVATLAMGNGDSSRGLGLELDAIAVVVMGGTLLTGGRGHMIGTLLGLLIFATVQQAILFDGRLSPWWGRIVVGALLLAFILLQRVLTRGTPR